MSADQTLEPGRATAIKAVLLLFAALLCFDVMSVLVKVLSPRYAAPELSAYRNVLGIVPSLGLLVWTGELRFRGSSLRIEKWPLAVARGLAVALAQLCFYAALARLELATVATLGQTYSLFVVILSVVLLSERVGPWRIGALQVQFVNHSGVISRDRSSDQPPQEGTYRPRTPSTPSSSSCRH